MMHLVEVIADGFFIGVGINLWGLLQKWVEKSP